MATAFWEAYQSTQEMYDGCATAIQYAVGHPENLIPLGSDNHDWQSHIHVPADVYPFRRCILKEKLQLKPTVSKTSNQRHKK
jgi:hypothetical protein